MIIKDTYRAHTCRVGRTKFRSIREASQQTGTPYRALHYRLTQGKSGYLMLPYDGVLPRSNNRRRQAAHVCAEGHWYRSQKEAGKALGLSVATICRRIGDSNRLDYFVMLG